MDLAGTLAATIRDGESPASTTDLPAGTSVGRFLLLGRLGAGATGGVYAAHDPELDRKVALRLLHPRVDGSADVVSRARLLREAQALARLSHPNVVAVHDVGTVQDGVWIAMEFVAGQTLDAWRRERRRHWSEVLPVLLDTARGVAAAHAAGLVHRDIKPENVMIDRGGRVRVMDFGLAQGRGASVEALSTGSDAGATSLSAVLRLTAAGAVRGTPAYMAPEQWEGREAEAASDQFGWCVMAWETLYGSRPFAGDHMAALSASVLAGRVQAPPSGRPVPRWLRQVLERGLSVSPARRWPSMTDLLTAIERGRRRGRAGAALLGLAGFVAVAGGVEGWRRRDLGLRGEACAASGAEIESVWGADGRRALREAFAAAAVTYGESAANLVVPRLDQQAASWSRARTEACLNDSVRASWDEDTFARSLGCLEEQRADLQALVAELTRGTPTTILKSVTAAASLRSADRCTDREFLRRMPGAPPQGSDALEQVRGLLSRAHSLEVTGDRDAALVAAKEALTRAQDLPEWPQARAAALARQGDLLGKLRDYGAAEAASTEAYFEAVRVGAWEAAARAATDLIDSVGGESRRERPVERINWARHAAQAVSNSGDPVGLWEAGRLNNLAIAHFDAGRLEEARDTSARAAALWERALGPDHPDVAASLDSAALMLSAQGDLAGARATHERALSIWTRALGPEHPSVAASLLNLAHIHFRSGDFGPARATNEQALEIYERALGPGHLDVARSLNSLGNILLALGDVGAAQARHERALSLRERALGPQHLDVAESLSNLADAREAAGALEPARALRQRALGVQIAALGPEHPDVGLTEVLIGRLELAEGRFKDAVETLERGLAVLGAAGPSRAAARARLDLARALVAVGARGSRALELARRARDEFRELGATDDVASAERWLAEREAAPSRPPRRGRGGSGPAEEVRLAVLAATRVVAAGALVGEEGALVGEREDRLPARRRGGVRQLRPRAVEIEEGEELRRLAREVVGPTGDDRPSVRAPDLEHEDAVAEQGVVAPDARGGGPPCRAAARAA